MTAFLTGIHRTLRPAADDAHGPLPPLLLTLTVVTGLVDAFSYLGLGHVFVANMTGNVVFLAFALAGAKGFSITASLAALASFAAGAAAGGRVDERLAGDRARLLGVSGTLQCVLLVAGVVIEATGGTAPAWSRYGLVVALAAAMGVQNAAARRLGVPDLTTTVLTLTITGIAADRPGTAPVARAAGRRVVAVLAMFVGALVGAALVVGHHGVYPVTLAAVLVAAVALVVWRLGSGTPAWARAGHRSPAPPGADQPTAPAPVDPAPDPPKPPPPPGPKKPPAGRTMTRVALTVFPLRVPATATRAPTVTALDVALEVPSEYVVEDCSSTVTTVPVRDVTVKLPLPTVLTVPMTPEDPRPNRPPPANGPGAVVLGDLSEDDAGVELDVARAMDSPTTARASTPAATQARTALPSQPRRTPPGVPGPPSAPG